MWARARDLQFEFIFAIVVGAPFGLSVSHANLEGLFSVGDLRITLRATGSRLW